MLFKRKKVNTIPDLDNQTMLKIYNALKSDKNYSFISKRLKVRTCHIVKLRKELKYIEDSVKSYIIANPACTKTQLISNVSSDIVPPNFIDTVITDIVAWHDGDPSTTMTFSEYKDEIIPEEVI